MTAVARRVDVLAPERLLEFANTRGDRAEREALIDLAGHWKHGYIPLDAVAWAIKMKHQRGDGKRRSGIGDQSHLEPYRGHAGGPSKSRLDPKGAAAHAGIIAGTRSKGRPRGAAPGSRRPSTPDASASSTRPDVKAAAAEAVRLRAPELRDRAAKGDKVAAAELDRRAAKRANGKAATTNTREAKATGRTADYERQAAEARRATAATEAGGHHEDAADAHRAAASAATYAGHHDRAAEHTAATERHDAAAAAQTPEYIRKMTPEQMRAELAPKSKGVPGVDDRAPGTPAEAKRAAALESGRAAAVAPSSSKPKRKPSALIQEYRARREEQDRRFEAHAGGGVAAQDTHTQEYKDYFGVGDHSTTPQEQRLTYKGFLEERRQASEHDRRMQNAYDHGARLGSAHGAQDDTSKHEDEYRHHAAGHDEEMFGQGYSDGILAAADKADKQAKADAYETARKAAGDATGASHRAATEASHKTAGHAHIAAGQAALAHGDREQARYHVAQAQIHADAAKRAHTREEADRLRSDPRAMSAHLRERSVAAGNPQTDAEKLEWTRDHNTAARVVTTAEGRTGGQQATPADAAQVLKSRWTTPAQKAAARKLAQDRHEKVTAETRQRMASMPDEELAKMLREHPLSSSSMPAEQKRAIAAVARERLAARKAHRDGVQESQATHLRAAAVAHGNEKPQPSTADMTRAKDEWQAANPGKKIGQTPGAEADIQRRAERHAERKFVDTGSTGNTPAEAASERARVKDAMARDEASKQTTVERLAAEKQGGNFTTAHRDELNARLKETHPVGMQVDARQPGIDRVTPGVVTQHLDNGMIQVGYRDHRGDIARGTFNPAHVTPSHRAERIDVPDGPGAGLARGPQNVPPGNVSSLGAKQAERAAQTPRQIHERLQADPSKVSTEELKRLDGLGGSFAPAARAELSKRNAETGRRDAAQMAREGRDPIAEREALANRVAGPNSWRNAPPAPGTTRLTGNQSIVITGPNAGKISEGEPSGPAGEARRFGQAANAGERANIGQAQAEARKASQGPPKQGEMFGATGEHQPDIFEEGQPSAAGRDTSSAPSIRVEHSGDGTVVYGTQRGDTDTTDALKAQGFKWSRSLGGWYLPRTWSESTRELRVRGLEARLGNKIEVQRGDIGRSGTAAERSQATIDRAKEIADAQRARAEKFRQESDAQDAAARRISDNIPFGQPILVGHHSQRRAEKDQERIHNGMRRSIEADSNARAAEQRASSAEARARMQTDPRAAARRLERSEAELRAVERRLNGTGKEIHGENHPATGEYADRLKARQQELRQNIEHDRGIAGDLVGGPTGEAKYGRHNVKPGDVVRVRGTSHVVHSTGPKNAKLMTEVGPLPYSYTQIQAHGPLEDASTETLKKMLANSDRIASFGNSPRSFPPAVLDRIKSILRSRGEG